MTTQHTLSGGEPRTLRLKIRFGLLALGLFFLAATPALAGHCNAQATAARHTCGLEAYEDYWIARGNCFDLLTRDERNPCAEAAVEERDEILIECEDRLEARQEVCTLLGGGPYRPDFDPANFVNPNDIGGSVTPNPYFALVVGNTWAYAGSGETVTVTVTDKTKSIAGVTCRVVNDVVREDGVVIEDTDDWYAQHLNGDVWYCGELARDFETFEGDDPEEPELVEIEGSFKAGRDSARPGILLLADPQVGDAYRQEMALGEAEDVAEVISITGTESVLAAACSSTCLVTRDFSPLEPGVEENKYYVPGIGLILEVDLEEGDRLELQLFTPGP